LDGYSPDGGKATSAWANLSLAREEKQGFDASAPAAFKGRPLKETGERLDAVPRVRLWTDDYSDLCRILK